MLQLQGLRPSACGSRQSNRQRSEATGSRRQRCPRQRPLTRAGLLPRPAGRHVQAEVVAIRCEIDLARELPGSGVVNPHLFGEPAGPLSKHPRHAHQARWVREEYRPEMDLSTLDLVHLRPVRHAPNLNGRRVAVVLASRPAWCRERHEGAVRALRTSQTPFAGVISTVSSTPAGASRPRRLQ